MKTDSVNDPILQKGWHAVNFVQNMLTFGLYSLNIVSLLHRIRLEIVHMDID